MKKHGVLKINILPHGENFKNADSFFLSLLNSKLCASPPCPKEKISVICSFEKQLKKMTEKTQ